MPIQPLTTFAVSHSREIRHVSAGQFRVPEEPAGLRTAPGPSSTTALASLQTMLAVQEVTPGLDERRQRAVRRGEALLAALSDLQLALLGAGDDAACLARLRTALADEAPAVIEPELADVLAAIEVRAAVELAKQERDD
ncbi:flagellar assembly protein FliX [Geminicoccus flavidas]|uniref:flagellar assembly protein FliX n=1 Tax=Geminicoccus flavidas TaxID=2506407 RepID=UPI001356CE52|nr:flagellar assembly protein FliX [Geminicoccus flavidas]